MRFALISLLAGLAVSAPSFAIDGYFADAGGAASIQSVKLGMIRQWHRQWLHRNNWHLTGYWEFALGYLKSDAPGGTA